MEQEEICRPKIVQKEGGKPAKPASKRDGGILGSSRRASGVDLKKRAKKIR